MSPMPTVVSSMGEGLASPGMCVLQLGALRAILPTVYLTRPCSCDRASARMRKSSSISYVGRITHLPTSSSRPGITQVERQAERRAGGRPPNGGETNTASRLLRAGRPRVPHHSVVQADCINLRSRRHRFPTLGALVQQLADHFLPRTAQRAGRNAGW